MRGRRPVAPRLRQAGDQVLQGRRVHRLDQVMVETGVGGALLVVLAAAIARERDEDDVPQRGILAREPRDLVPVDPGKTDVDEHDVGGMGARGVDCVVAVGDDADVVPEQLEERGCKASAASALSSTMSTRVRASPFSGGRSAASSFRRRAPAGGR